MPDALSKTIPIWCCVLNHLIANERSILGLKKENLWNLELFTPPTIVSKSEHAFISAQIEGFVRESALVDLGSISEIMTKPLRPLWITPDSRMETQDWSDLPFFPVVCLTASDAVSNGIDRRNGYSYVQGAADDHELWSMVFMYQNSIYTDRD